MCGYFLSDLRQTQDEVNVALCRLGFRHVSNAFKLTPEVVSFDLATVMPVFVIHGILTSNWTMCTATATTATAKIGPAFT